MLDFPDDPHTKTNQSRTSVVPPPKLSKRILLVDDDTDVLYGAKLWLSAAGYQTSTASDGEQAISTAVQDRPDGIVLDVRMPRKDGLAALAELKQREETKRIPVVMLSASQIDQQRALDAGARFFLTKPYAGKNLVAAVGAALRERDV